MPLGNFELQKRLEVASTFLEKEQNLTVILSFESFHVENQSPYPLILISTVGRRHGFLLFPCLVDE